MKKSELFLTFLKVPLDYAMIFLAGLTAYYIRFRSPFTQLRPIVFDLQFSDFIRLDVIMALLWVVIFAFAGLYRIEKKSLSEITSRVFLATATSTLALIVTIFFQREIFSSRFLMLALWLISFIYVMCARILLRYIQKILYRRGIGMRRIALVGSGHCNTVLERAFLDTDLGSRIVIRYKDINEETINDIGKRAKEIDEIVAASDQLSVDDVSKLLHCAWTHNVEFRYSADLVQASMGNPRIATIAGIPIVSLEKTPLEGWGRIVKRITDIIGSVIAIIVFSPVMVITALLIKYTSEGPVLYHLDNGLLPQRVGMKGMPFVFYKFRSMRFGTHNLKFSELADLNARKGTPMTKIPNDPRVTTIGRFIRRYSIDELPQFFNVLWGTMSLVGPRPHEIEEVAQYDTHHRWALSIKPGITGLPQVSGRSDLNFEDEVRLDTYYIRNWSWWTDIWIMLKTPSAVVSKRQAE